MFHSKLSHWHAVRSARHATEVVFAPLNAMSTWLSTFAITWQAVYHP